MIDTWTTQPVFAVNITHKILVKVAGPGTGNYPLIFIKDKLMRRLSPPSLEIIDTELPTELITVAQVYRISNNGGECLGGDKHAVCQANECRVVPEAPHRYQRPPSNVHL